MTSNFFKKPFSLFGPYIKDSNRNICFTIICKDELAQEIVDKLNDESCQRFNARKKIDNILIDDIIVLKTRGWGYLTGSLKLSSEQALKEQNILMDFVVDKLKN
jgi:hypothetical protein